MKLNIVNCCPHSLTLRTAEGEDLVLEPLSKTDFARAETLPKGGLETLEGCPVPVAPVTKYGRVLNLPDPAPDTIYLVSGVTGAAVAQHMPHRTDVFCPGTGPNDNAVRNEAKQVIAVTQLNRAV